MTVATGNNCGDETSQLNCPFGLDIDDDNQCIIIADCCNHPIVDWKMGEKNGKVIAGGQGRGNPLDQLNCPTDILIHKEKNSLLISDRGNRRVLRWSRRQWTTQGEVIFDNINCRGLTIDHQRYIYISVFGKDEIRR